MYSSKVSIRLAANGGDIESMPGTQPLPFA
jgi:hypothetical protein